MPRPIAPFVGLLLSVLLCAGCGKPVEKPESGPCENGAIASGESCDPSTNGEPGPANCGNGTVDDDETCDGDCPTECAPPDACTVATLVGDASTCDAECTFDEITGCVDADGCCPQGCDGSTDSDCSSNCGDGVVEGNETCDGDCPTQCDDGDPCTSDFLAGSAANCDAECRYNAIPDCTGATSCEDVTCPQGQVCDPTDLTCVESCEATGCPTGEVCNTGTRQCQVDNCNGADPTQCDGNAAKPLWDPIKCFCAECVSDSDCNTAAGEVCGASGACVACQPCDASTPGTCSGGTPYCVDECCVECIGTVDCAAGQLCLDGFCGEPPSCAADPTVCPAGYTCNQAIGECEAPMTGQMCDPQDPHSCPVGTFCDPSTQTCAGGGGTMGCGLCNADCTCDNGLTCNGFLCEGCSNNPLDPAYESCPDGQVCLDPTAPVCYPLN